jgi:hypothetical protein
VFADFEPNAAGGYDLVPLDAEGREAPQAQATVSSGLVAAVRLGEEQPTWVVTGTDEAGVNDAIDLIDTESLRERYAVGVDPRGEFALPVTGQQVAP